ncbi:ABC transporter substrate-binding protein [Catellatospora vulcania]|uniref:ABC transporter substrate-binding protein n=1 Tax=Catellatospora vulcania TaxID=1460450 RepID=UPI0012D41E42|nr:ABC transporter substrate-binding protein [Catellatospora vulcania]
MRFSRAVIAAACASLLTLSACSSGPDDSQNPAYQGAYLYGTDGNMANEFGAIFKEQPGLLNGMKGTMPLTELDESFLQRLRSVKPGLKDLLFAGEAYDAVVISALAAQQAGSTEPDKIAKYINAVTVGGNICRSIKQCLNLAKTGKAISYRGVTVRYGFAEAGEPATTSYGTVHFDSANQLDNGKTEYLGTGNERDVTGQKPPAPVKGGTTDKQLIFGGLLPKTGALAYTTPPMEAGALLAIAEINDEGGVLGKKVKWIDGDDGTSPVKAKATIASHHAAGVQVLIGPGASGVALASLEESIGYGMVMFSPCNTSPDLTGYDDKGLYFRTAPSDVLQARALADVMLRDGLQKIAIVTHSDNYGKKLAEGVTKELVRAGVTEVNVQTYVYQITDGGEVKDQAELTKIANQVIPTRPDGVLVIGYSESAGAIKALAAAGATIRH